MAERRPLRAVDQVLATPGFRDYAQQDPTRLDPAIAERQTAAWRTHAPLGQVAMFSSGEVSAGQDVLWHLSSRAEGLLLHEAASIANTAQGMAQAMLIGGQAPDMRQYVRLPEYAPALAA